MLQSATLDFLRQLKANNAKEWFDQHRQPYEAAKADALTLLIRVLADLERADPALAASSLSANTCLFRINRDVRFSADKSPYKTSFGAWFNAGGKKISSAGYYLNLEPGNSFASGGVYQPEPAALASIRQEIDYNRADFEQALAHPAFQKYYRDLSREDALARPPKGYEADHPAIEYLKMKSFTASFPLTDELVTSAELAHTVAAAFAGVQPLVAFLNHALVPN